MIRCGCSRRVSDAVAFCSLLITAACAAPTSLPTQGAFPSPILASQSVPSQITYAAAAQMTTTELARLLLPDQPPGRFVSHKLDRFFSPGLPLSGVEFFARPAPLGIEFCRRDGIYASVADGSASPTAYLAAAPKCRMRAGASFARVQPSTAFVGAQQALRRLLALQQAARRGSTRVMVTCKTETSTNPCNRPGATVLADLPLHQIYIIEPRGAGWEFDVMPTGPGQVYWKVLLPPENTPDRMISLVWRQPAPF